MTFFILYRLIINIWVCLCKLTNRGDVNGDQMLLFNLSGINTAVENILRCELHFYGRKKLKWPHRSPNYRMKFFSISKEDISVVELNPVNVSLIHPVSPGRHGGWQVFDITSQMSDCVEQPAGSNSTKNHLMGVTFQTVKNRSRFVAIPLKSLVKMDSTPFLIIFSNDKDLLLENVGDSKNDELKAVTKYLKDDLEEQDTKDKDVKKTSEHLVPLKRYARSAIDSNQIHEVDYIGKQSTMMSWIENNEYPENSVLPVYPDFSLKTNPGILVPRKRNRTDETNRTIPYPTIGPFFGKKRRGKKKTNTAILPNFWQSSIHLNDKERKLMTGLRSKSNNADVKMAQNAKGADAGLCQRERLVINFSEISWNDWIIAPQSFEAYYCSGQCRFPHAKKRNPSNHAIIQSIVNAIGLRREVPAPCCVPDVMSSLTLLYFDENQNVALKNYPGMIVESCACR